MFLFFVTPCLVVAVKLCMELIPIKKKVKPSTYCSCIKRKILANFHICMAVDYIIHGEFHNSKDCKCCLLEILIAVRRPGAVTLQNSFVGIGGVIIFHFEKNGRFLL